MMNSSTGHKHDGTTAEGPKILTANIDDSAGNQGEVYFSSGSAISKLAVGTSGQFLQTAGAAADPVWATANQDQSQDGSTVQVVNTNTGAVATGTTTIPEDDTIPQNTEGDQYMTLAITPGATTNNLIIHVVVNYAHSSGGPVTTALFQDSTANALAAVVHPLATVNSLYSVSFTHFMAAGTVSATTFKVRIGSATGGTTTFNGTSGAREAGGVLSSSITITEIKGS